MMNARREVCLSLAAAVLAGCATTRPSPPASADPKVAWREGQAAYLAWNARRIGWKVTASGLQYHPVKRRRGPLPGLTPESQVTAHYEGRLINGDVFDSSWKRGEPIRFSPPRVIAGWREGLAMMRPGETWEFAIPAGLAYGDKDLSVIPAGSALLFRVELISVEP